MKYFGILDPKILELSDKEIDDLLLSMGLFETNNICEFKDIKDMVMRFEAPVTSEVVPSKELTDAFYEFIIDLYQSQILEIKLPFLSKFNDEIYGLDLKEQKTIGLKHFKEIYNIIYIDVLTVYEQKKHDSGVVHTFNVGKLKMLYYQFESLKSRLSNTGAILEFLTGDKNIYIESNFVENEIVQELIKFEAWKQVIVELNSRYEFEDGFYFSDIHKDESNFKKYDYIFKILESYHFTNKKILSFKVNIPSKMDTLYEFLKTKNVIHHNIIGFKNFCLNEYGINLKTIHNFDTRNDNLKHLQRMKKFQEDWDNLFK